MNDTPDIVCYGEILWDVFPNRKVIGGAPLNVALRLHRLGAASAIISKVGIDPLGEEVQQFLKELNFPQQGIQKDSSFATGEVIVTLDSEGVANYTIAEPVAWDHISCTEEALDMVRQSRIFLFGSLVCRNTVSRETLMKLLKEASFSVFDVNLRAPFYTEKLLKELLQQSDFVKMNDEELIEIASYFNCPEQGLEAQSKWLMEAIDLSGLCVTKGAHGALLLYEGEMYNQSGFEVSVMDTVGAGDSFLATLLAELFLKKTSPAFSLRKACAVGALVASKEGANCEVTENEIAQIISQN